MSVVKRLAALGCVGLLASTVAACGSTAKSGGSTKASITMGTTRPFVELDPAGAYDYGSWQLFYNVFQTLMSFQPNATTPTPDAAQACAFTDATDRTYHCTLKSGLTFSNGDALNAEAVKFSFDRVLKIYQVLGPEKDGGPYSLLSTLSSVTTSGDLDVTFHLNTSDATFPDKIASGAGDIVDPKVYPANALLGGGKVVGSGPYQVDKIDGSLTDPKDVVLSVNPGYKGAATTPQNSQFTMKYYADPASLKQALTSGQIDIADNDLTPADNLAFEANQQYGKGIQVDTGGAAEIRMLILDQKVKPMDNVYVRRAVAQLIDQQALATNVFKNTVDPLYSVIPAGIGGHTAAFQDYYGKPSTARAKSMLKDAGVATPVKFSISYADNALQGAEEANELARQLNASGLFQVTVDKVSGGLGALQTGWSADKYAAFTESWSPDYPDADDYVTPFVGAQNVYNTHYVNSQISDQLVPETQRAADRTAANTPFAQIQSQYAQDAVYIPLYQDKQYLAVQSNITGVPLTLDVTGIFRIWVVGKASN
jgi:peptide/nickel transport system substrate-binding protein